MKLEGAPGPYARPGPLALDGGPRLILKFCNDSDSDSPDATVNVTHGVTRPERDAGQPVRPATAAEPVYRS